MTDQRVTYNKLVRDRIPELIERDGRSLRIETLTEAEFRTALLDKLLEEAGEAREATAEQLPTELADVLEVLDAIVSTFGIQRATPVGLQEQRRNERGGFDRRVKLCWME
jgi:predicted house-cleaning noncanonical NTP pyrophosphatase (MazG superfamily)